MTSPGNLQTATQPSAQGIAQSHKIDEQRLFEEYTSFLKRLEAWKMEDDYRAAIRDINSEGPDKQKHGLAVLGASGEIDAIAWIAPLIDSEDGGVRIAAGSALEKIVSGYELRRRDKSQPEKIVILPRSASDIDLRPLAWLILRMIRLPDDGNTAAYAATMAGYLGLSEFAGELQRLLKSRHPAVSRSARGALSTLRAN